MRHSALNPTRRGYTKCIIHARGMSRHTVRILAAHLHRRRASIVVRQRCRRSSSVVVVVVAKSRVIENVCLYRRMRVQPEAPLESDHLALLMLLCIPLARSLVLSHISRKAPHSRVALYGISIFDTLECRWHVTATKAAGAIGYWAADGFCDRHFKFGRPNRWI